MLEQASGVARHPRRQIRRLLLPSRELDRHPRKRREQMEKSFPGPGKGRPGGGELSSYRSSRCGPSAPPRILPRKKDRFSRPRNPAYTAPTPFLLGWRNGGENSASVTTKQLFRPNQRRRAVCGYRNSYGIYVSWPGRGGTPRGGGQLRRTRQKPRPKSAHGIFALIHAL